MLYGAYRRWKEVEVQTKGGNGGAPSSSSSSSSTSSPSGTRKGKKKSKNAADQFYDALKKFGSGPVEKVRSNRVAGKERELMPFAGIDFADGDRRAAA